MEWKRLILAVHALVGTALDTNFPIKRGRWVGRACLVSAAALGSHLLLDRLPHLHPEAIWLDVALCLPFLCLAWRWRRLAGPFACLGLLFSLLPDALHLPPALAFRLTGREHWAWDVFHPLQMRSWLRDAPPEPVQGAVALAAALLLLAGWRRWAHRQGAGRRPAPS